MSLFIREITISPNTLKTGESFYVSAKVEEITWESVKNTFQNWGEVRRSFADWEAVRDWIYSIPDPVVDADAVYTSDGKAIFDVDAVQISISGGATLTHTAEDLDTFVKEVKHE